MINPIYTDDEYYIYKIDVDVSIVLTSTISFDPSSTATLAQLNQKFNKEPDNTEFLRGELASVDSLTYNDCTNLQFDKLKYFVSLKDLALVNCNLTSIPVEICDLFAIENLDLNSNPITSIPTEISNLSNLQKINLDNCSVSNISPLNKGNLIISCRNQVIDIGNLTLNSTGNKYVLDYSFLRDLNNEIPSLIKVNDGGWYNTNNKVLWSSNKQGQQVSFEFSISTDPSGNYFSGIVTATLQ